MNATITDELHGQTSPPTTPRPGPRGVTYAHGEPVRRATCRAADANGSPGTNELRMPTASRCGELNAKRTRRGTLAGTTSSTRGRAAPELRKHAAAMADQLGGVDFRISVLSG